MSFNLNDYFSSLNYGFPQVSFIDWLQYHNFYVFQHFKFINQNSSTQLNEYPNVQSNVKIEPTDFSVEPQPNSSDDNSGKKEIIQIEPKINPENTSPKYYRSKNQDRNLSSIVIRNFTNYINGHPKLLKIISEIIEKKGLTITADEYKSLFLRVFPLGQSYVGIKKLKEFLQKQTDARLITLILMRKFISTDYFTVMIKSNKVAKSAKLKELLHGKRLWNMLLHNLK